MKTTTMPTGEPEWPQCAGNTPLLRAELSTPAGDVDVDGIEPRWVDPRSCWINVGVIQSLNTENLAAWQRKDRSFIDLNVVALCLQGVDGVLGVAEVGEALGSRGSLTRHCQGCDREGSEAGRSNKHLHSQHPSCLGAPFLPATPRADTESGHRERLLPISREEGYGQPMLGRRRVPSGSPTDPTSGGYHSKTGLAAHCGGGPARPRNRRVLTTRSSTNGPRPLRP